LPTGDAASATPGYEIGGAVRPGFHRIEYEDDAGAPLASVEVAWWDVARLDLEVSPLAGMRREDLIAKGDDTLSAAGVERYARWQERRDAERSRGSIPQIRVHTATAWAAAQTGVTAAAARSDVPSAAAGRSDVPSAAGRSDVPSAAAGRSDAGPRFVPFSETEIEAVEVVEMSRRARPGGIRFGSLVHAVLAVVPLRASGEEIARAASLQKRILRATDGEEAAARALVTAVLAHPILERAARAQDRGECRRETPVVFRLDDRECVDGVVDLAFREDGAWTVVDYKTDHDLTPALGIYRRQVALYARAIAAATGEPARGVLLGV
jgi:ATP-dependent exoDNAse (exonuclease V) beta subunit